MAKPKTLEEKLAEKLKSRDAITPHNRLIDNSRTEPINSQPIVSSDEEIIANQTKGTSSPEYIEEKKNQQADVKLNEIKNNSPVETHVKIQNNGVTKEQPSESAITPVNQELVTVKKRRVPTTFKKVQPNKSDRYTPKTFRVDVEVLEMFEKYMDIKHGDYQKIINLSLINAMLSDEFISQRILEQSVEEYNRLIELEEEYQEM